MAIAIQTWQIYFSVIFIISIIFFVMQNDTGPDALAQIWQILKLVLGAVAATASTLWAIFSFQSKKTSIENNEMLKRMETMLAEGMKSMREEVKRNAENDRKVEKLLTEEIAGHKAFREYQERRWDQQERTNKEIFDKIERINNLKRK